MIDFLNKQQQSQVQLHQILQDKLFLEKIQSCNTKKELDFYIKPKDKLIALHDNFLKYGTKAATSFIIIDIDNVNMPLNDFAKEVKYNLGDMEPNWITKTNKGFHVGFILQNPIWLNNQEQVKQAYEIKRDLTLLFDADIAGSHRLIGYWRNPLTHKSIINNKKLFTLDELKEMATSRYFISFNLFDNMQKNQTKAINRKLTKKEISKSNWEQIDKTGFTQGNRNNFLFNKVIGMLYNRVITNNQVLSTLQSINDNQLEDKEIKKISKSIKKYHIQPIETKDDKLRLIKRGEYSNAMYQNQIHNYKENNKTIFARQKLGQKISNIKVIKKTIEKLVDGYFKIYKEHKSFNNKNIEKSSNMNKRTIQRYRNEKKLEDEIKYEAFKRYIESMAPKGVMPTVTHVNDILNIVIETVEFYYQKSGKLLRFKIDSNNNLIFYDLQQHNHNLAA